MPRAAAPPLAGHGRDFAHRPAASRVKPGRPSPAALLLLLPLLTGCALFESKQTRALRASPDYKSGYGDGCSSASVVNANPRADTQIRDDQAFAGNAAYRMGWNEGFGACRPAPMPGNDGMDRAPYRGGLMGCAGH